MYLVRIFEDRGLTSLSTAAAFQVSARWSGTAYKTTGDGILKYKHRNTVNAVCWRLQEKEKEHSTAFCTPAITVFLTFFLPPPVLFHGYGVQVRRHPERPSAGPAAEDRGAATERRAHRRAGAGAGHQRWSDQAAADGAGPAPQLIPADSQLPGDGKHRWGETWHFPCLWCIHILVIPKVHNLLDIFHMKCWHVDTKAAYFKVNTGYKCHQCQMIEIFLHFLPSGQL